MTHTSRAWLLAVGTALGVSALAACYVLRLPAEAVLAVLGVWLFCLVVAEHKWRQQ